MTTGQRESSAHTYTYMQPTGQTKGKDKTNSLSDGTWVMRYEVFSTDLQSLSASLILLNATGTKSH